MAQHYPVTDEKIIKSVRRIASHVYPDIKAGLLMDWGYYGKDIRHLPREFNPDGYAFTVGPYNMARVWEKDTGAEEEATLEAHLDFNGNLTRVFYPL